MTSEVRAVTDQTCAAAAELLIRFFREEGFATPPARIAENLEQMLADPACWCALAMQGEAAQAVITVSTIRLIEAGRIGEIGDLYVLPEYRGWGLARRLIKHAQTWCRDQGCSSVEVTITPDGERRHGLSRFYGRLGFMPTGRTIASVTLAANAPALGATGNSRRARSLIVSQRSIRATTC